MRKRHHRLPAILLLLCRRFQHLWKSYVSLLYYLEKYKKDLPISSIFACGYRCTSCFTIPAKYSLYFLNPRPSMYNCSFKLFKCSSIVVSPLTTARIFSAVALRTFTSMEFEYLYTSVPVIYNRHDSGNTLSLGALDHQEYH